MENAYILWHGEGEVESRGDNIWGVDNNARELKRWPESDKEAAYAELSKYRCRYWDVKALAGKTVKDADEYALEHCEIDEEDGEYICGGFLTWQEKTKTTPLKQSRPEVAMAKTERLYIRVSPDLKDKIQKAAEAENRTISGWIENLIKNKLKEKPN